MKKHNSEYWCFTVVDPKDNTLFSGVLKSKSVQGAAQRASNQMKKFIEETERKASYIEQIWKVTSEREHEKGVREHEIKKVGA